MKPIYKQYLIKVCFLIAYLLFIYCLYIAYIQIGCETDANERRMKWGDLQNISELD